MKKVCFVHNVSVVGGAERMSQAIMKGLPKNKYGLHLVCPEQGELIKQCADLGVECHTHNLQQPDFFKPIKSLLASSQWCKLIKSNDFDIFHTGDLISTRSLLSAAHKTNTDIICHIHFPFEQGFADWVFKNRPQPKGFIFCSQELQDDVGPKLKKVCPDAKQWVIHNGVDVHKFKPVEYNNEKIRVGIIANLQFRKGHDDFLNMAKLVTEQGYDLQFDIIGGDILQEPREEKLKQLVSALGIADSVIFHGQVKDVKSILQCLDVVVCASHEEAFPVSILEAMACGKPVVSTNVNGIPEAIIDGETGFMVEPFKPELLSDALCRLLNDRTLMQQFSINSRQRVVQLFSEEEYINKIIRTYN